jgi:hypothetical protein
LNTWIEFGYVPSPAEVSEKEVINFTRVKGDMLLTLIFMFRTFPWRGYSQLMRYYSGKSLWPIRIGCINPKDQIPKWSMETIQSITDEDYYFVCVEIFKGLKRTPQVSINIYESILMDLFFLTTSYEVVLYSNCFYFACGDLLAPYPSFRPRRSRSSAYNYGFVAGDKDIFLDDFQLLFSTLLLMYHYC